MNLSVTSDDGQTVNLQITERITQQDARREPLVEMLGPTVYARHVRLDLSNTTYIDSSGVGWLLNCHKRLREGGGKLSLVSPHPLVINVLRILKLDELFTIESEAVAPAPAATESQ